MIWGWLKGRRRRGGAADNISSDAVPPAAPALVAAAPLAMIHANRDLVLSEMEKLGDGPFGLDRASVAWVEGFIERRRAAEGAEPSAASGLASTLGCYLGEAIIAAAGGRWETTAGGQLGIHFTNDNWCFPISKVSKQLSDGVEAGESILSFYDVSTTVVAKEGL